MPVPYKHLQILQTAPVSTDTELRRNKETITSNKRERIDERTNIEQKHADITVNIRKIDNRNDLDNDNVVVTIAYNGLGVSINYCHLFVHTVHPLC